MDKLFTKFTDILERTQNSVERFQLMRDTLSDEQWNELSNIPALDQLLIAMTELEATIEEEYKDD